MSGSIIIAALAILMAGAAAAQAPAEVLFRDVRVYDGRSERSTAPTSVLVRGNRSPPSAPAPSRPRPVRPSSKAKAAR